MVFRRGGVLAWLVATASACTMHAADRPADGCADARPDEVGVCRFPDRSFAEPECCAVLAERRCDVVDVDPTEGQGLLAGRLSSYYQLDAAGEPPERELASTVSVLITGGGAEAVFGQLRFASFDGDTIAELEEPALHPELTGYETYRVAREGEAGSFTIRVFTAYELGVVLHHHPSYEHGSRRVATVDCRGVVRGAPVPPIEPEQVDCEAAWADPAWNAAGDGLGDVYDVTSDGCFTDEPSASQVRIERSEAGWSLDLGHQRYSEQQGDDVVAPVDAAGEWPLTYRVQTAPDDGGATLEIQVFPHSGLGMVSDATGQLPLDSGSLRRAVLDCRGLPRW